MRVRVPSSIIPHGLALAVLAAGTFLPLGCTQRGGESAFRRFWGFEHTPSHTVENQESQSHSANLLPKFWGGRSADQDWTEDPFLTPAEPEAGPLVADAGAPFDSEAVPPLPAGFQEWPGTPGTAKQDIPADGRGNSLQLAQHQTAVHDISSADRSEPLESLETLLKSSKPQPPDATGASQLERLKIALRHDAKTQLPPKNFEEIKIARRRVETMMKTARRQMKFGEYEIALRWAVAAEQLAEGAELFFGPDEDPPGDLVRILQDRLKLPSAPPPVPLLPTESSSAPVPAQNPPPQPPALSVEFPAGPSAETQPPPAELLPQIEGSPRSQAHTTHAMKEAVIAPETLTAAPQTPPSANPAGIAPARMHRRSLKVDARRVNANQGAMVSVEGQLNPPVETPLPDLPLAPPAAEEESSLPPVDLAMTDPSLMTTPTPPLPPPNSVETPRFLYADSANTPAPKPVKNVHWEEPPPPEPKEARNGWIFPLIGFAGVLLIVVFAWKRLRA